MPEYLAPGVFVEEVSYRAKSIEGVSTTTTGFVGATRYGPISIEPDVITSLVEFERVYGGRQQLQFTDSGKPVDNYMHNAVRAFFEEGGKRLYVARAFSGDADAASSRVVDPVPPANVAIQARFPGRAGDGRVRLQFSVSPNRLVFETSPVKRAVLRGVSDRDVVFIDKHQDLGGGVTQGLYLVERDPQDTEKYTFDDQNGHTFELQGLKDQAEAIVRIVTANVYFESSEPGLPFFAAVGLALDREHKSAGKKDSLFDYFAQRPANISAARSIPIVIRALTVAEATAERDSAQTARDKAKTDDDNAKTALNKAKNDLKDAKDAVTNAPAGTDLTPLQNTVDAMQAAFDKATADKAATAAILVDADKQLTASKAALSAANNNANRSGVQFLTDYVVGVATPNRFTMAELTANTGTQPVMDAVFFLTGGSDGTIPNSVAYEGAQDDNDNKSGLLALEDIEDISIVAAPGSTVTDANAQSVANALISHAERMKYRIAVLDSIKEASIADTREYRGKFDSKYAAFYYPWVRIIDPETGQENHYPPSGFVAGIYARNDIDRAVYKAPANEVVRLAIGFEKFLNKAQQEVLNPEGVNCFRFFEGRGMRLWGARTATSDPEWKYVNLRRYFAYLERSIDKGTQWAVFEPNGERLWANVRRTIEDFLLNEWQNGALLGDRPEKGYFVKCDRSTMTQNDLDNGRLVCLVGVAALRPAEFVIFRIGQWTADRKI
ncbi:MAG TPA: phage tail sheath subtilisin-like domain-containing protein [Sphingomicrobium sp.]